MDTPKAAAWVVRKIIKAREDVNQMRPGQNSLISTLENLVKQGKFQIHKAYVQMQPQFPKVTWKSLHLHTHIHPRFKFHLWLAIHQRLATVDRLMKFGIQAPLECVFCATNMETFEHLYFGCPKTNKLWDRVLKSLGITRQIGSWKTELNWLSRLASRKNCKAEMTTAIFTMVVYCIWHERNSIRFNKGGYNMDEICKEIAKHIHIQGRKKTKWQIELESLNNFP
ncbi:PREDICTED: uncharacterized protein LOC109239871 [Nicotiana attenuata]|uniref:uncharacterized protein LOC109239871 n=1 Tax=Nicotiana attenuata TaxID=49451 RepID=UPI000905BC40|nr:PREDICTED: uncharacterized protein LOC109239871 [Nicotiana attenuata]